MKDIVKFLTSVSDEVIARVKNWAPDDFELRVETAILGMPIHEANEHLKEMSRIADVIAGQTDSQKGAAWRNVAWNLNPTTGKSQRVARSYNR